MKSLLFAFLVHMAASFAFAQSPDPMQYGRAYMAEGDYPAAAKSFAQALRLNPSDPIALNNLAVAKAAAGENLAALDLLTQARRASPNRPDIQENLVNMQIWLKAYGGAKPADLQANTFAPEPAVLWPVLAALSSEKHASDSPQKNLPRCKKKKCK